MNTLILGAGVVGTTLAYHLARAGHAVAVIDRQPGPGLETSFANGGQIAAAHATPWATPETPWKALRWLGREDAPLAFRWRRWDPALWAWGLRFLSNCTPGRTARNTERTLRLARYSRESLKDLRDELGLDYQQRTHGILYIYRHAKEFETACRHAAYMSSIGLTQTTVDRAALVAMEPALAHAAPSLVGAIHSPDDESGDAYLITQAMESQAKALGAVFHYGETVLALEAEAGRLTGVRTDTATHRADTYVLALGSWSPHLARPLGLKMPIYPAKGYSMTLPLTPASDSGAPQFSITDDERKMVFSRLGGRLRAAGTAEFVGWNTTPNPQRAQQIIDHARSLFPQAGDYQQAETWCGLRPKTPDSVPYLGATPYPNLFLNTGHGTLGWTMAVGSARVLVDLLAGRKPEIDLQGLGLDR